MPEIRCSRSRGHDLLFINWLFCWDKSKSDTAERERGPISLQKVGVPQPFAALDVVSLAKVMGLDESHSQGLCLLESISCDCSTDLVGDFDFICTQGKPTST